ncbi:MAG TPA: serine/threonine-protein kinase [Polyangiaceae bacterium]|nr:serine/threonine-protein kinase [Polyangiaceae bacterium]
MGATRELSPKLEKYELLEEIGHGGMATVYRARDKRLGREVAVKIIHRHLRENQEVAQRFQSEARAVAKLRHPNIVEVFDVSDASEDERYLVVELVRGTTLRKLLSQHGAFPPEVAAAVGIALASALDHAHRLGVIHRDVKPENVLVGDAKPTGSTEPEPVPIKLTDFGIAKLLDAQGVTSTGQVLGSPAHMAPEQIEGGEVSARSDVFGLGVLLYECMVGRLPFDGKNPAQVLRRVLDGAFTPADRAEPRVGAAFSAILSKALSHVAADRYASTADLATALREELTALGFDSSASELEAFLSDPARYKKEHEERIVARLTARAENLQKVRNVPSAAACFNRALAYRPQDPRLLAAVSTLARGARARRFVERGALALLSVLLVAAGALALARRSPARLDAPRSDVSSAVPSSAPSAVTGPKASAGVQPAASASAAVSASPTTRRNVVPRPTPRPSAEPSDAAVLGEQLARVQIVVNGPQSATVRIDGRETPWFGKIQELTPGEHVFEFIPPDEQCCEPGQTLRVKVRPASGPADVQTVQGRIEFRPATFDIRGTAGSVVTCGALGEFPVPSQQQVPLRDGPRRVRCQFIPPPGSVDPPKEFDVTLRPGRLSTNLGQ